MNLAVRAQRAYEVANRSARGLQKGHEPSGHAFNVVGVQVKKGAGADSGLQRRSDLQTHGVGVLDVARRVEHEHEILGALTHDFQRGESLAHGRFDVAERHVVGFSAGFEGETAVSPDPLAYQDSP